MTKSNIETRENGAEIIAGLGVVFGQRSEKLGGWFYETIHRDAFNEADTSDVVGLFNHDDNYVLGRSSSGTMRFDIKSDGIYYEIDPDMNAAWVRDQVVSPMRRGDITGSSFQFTIMEEDGDEWQYDKVNRVYHRTILRVDTLYDLSPVTRPAYSQTSSSVSKRSLDAFEDFKSKTEAEIKLELEQQQDGERRLEDHFKRSAARARVRIYAVSQPSIQP